MTMVTVCNDLEALSQAKAELFAAQARQAVQACDRFSVALAGGNTPRRNYELLGGEPLRELVPWRHTHVIMKRDS